MQSGQRHRGERAQPQCPACRIPQEFEAIVGQPCRPALRQRMYDKGGDGEEGRADERKDQRDARQRHAAPAREIFGEQPGQRRRDGPHPCDAESGLCEPGAGSQQKRDADCDENIAEAADEAQLLVVLPLLADGARLLGFKRAQTIGLLDRENPLSDGEVEALRRNLQGMLSTTTLRLV